MKIVKHDNEPLEGSLEEVFGDESPKYDPNKKYTWRKEDVFYLTGEDFGKVLHSIRVILSSEEAQKILICIEANKALESTLETAVIAGVIKEVPDNSK